MMKAHSARASTAPFFAATLAALLGSLLAGCGGGSLPAVLHETEVLRHLPRGTRVMLPGMLPDAPPGAPGFVIEPPEGAWLVSAAYLSRMHELLGGPPPPEGAPARVPSE